nr:uncharacterized protein LOC112923768 [Vulpes vulpes]
MFLLEEASVKTWQLGDPRANCRQSGLSPPLLSLELRSAHSSHNSALEGFGTSTPPKAVPLPKSSQAAPQGTPGSGERPDLPALVSVGRSAGGLLVAPLPATPPEPPTRSPTQQERSSTAGPQELSMRPAGFRNFLLLVSSVLIVGLSAVPQSFSPSLRSGTGAPCRLSRAESERRCRAPGQPPGGALCHGRGRCDCGVCICHVSEPGVYFGPLCECHEWVLSWLGELSAMAISSLILNGSCSSSLDI